MSIISDNIARIKEDIDSACVRASRHPDDVKLIAISKQKPAEVILEAVTAGLQHFGENRVQESQEKIPLVESRTDQSIVWHMVGHIQSRKAKDVAPLFDVVHSIDSERLAVKLARAAHDDGATLKGLIEVNVSGEVSKEGIHAVNWQSNQQVADVLVEQIRRISQLDGLSIVGLMTMAPFTDDMGLVRSVFSNVFALRQMLSSTLGLPLPELSMGMTNDYPVAIEEGATMIRIGRAIFGERT